MSDNSTSDKGKKSDDKKGIEMEEREKMLNGGDKDAKDNKDRNSKDVAAINNSSDNKTDSDKNNKKPDKDGMEVKPKKIPIGGIQMPGFFTRSKSKEKCKQQDEDNDAEGSELIGGGGDAKVESTPTTASYYFSVQRIKLPIPNLFRNSKLFGGSGSQAAADSETTPAAAAGADGDTNHTPKSKDTNASVTGEVKEKKTILDTIRLPLVSVFPRLSKHNKDSTDGAINLENQPQAGLASMETLDDKSTAGDEKTGDELKNVPLDKTDVEGQNPWKLHDCREKLMAYRVAITALFVFIMLVILIAAMAFPSQPLIVEVPIVDGKYLTTVSSCGLVQGIVEDNAIAFRGIPYAQPPVGPLRFQNAAPLNDIQHCWEGTLIAHNSTNVCIQVVGNSGDVEGSEDCLTLDIVTPFVRYDNPLPVIVLIGADSFIGGSPGKMRPSARYARSRDVVFVRPNFRMGVLGFLALDAFSQEQYPSTSGNYGLSDILEALRWIQLNIGHFGGDKDQVVVVGHGAGATMVTALSTVYNAHKLFSRVWVSSGGAIFLNKILQEAEQENRSYLKLVDCDKVTPKEVATCLRSLPAEKLVTAVEGTWRKPSPDLPESGEAPAERHEWLVLDGHILREHPASVWARPGGLSVSLVIGTTAQVAANEILLKKHVNWTEQLVQEHVDKSFLAGLNLTHAVLERYPLTIKGLISMVSDIRTVCPLLAIATQMPNVSFYVVTEGRAVDSSNITIADVDSDVDAILGRYEPKTVEQRRYAQAMQTFFYHYVWHGQVDQSAGAIHQPKVLLVGQDVLANATYSHCAFWINNNIVLPYAALD